MATKEQTENNHAAFIRRASQCDYNYLWTCTHPDNKGNKCVKICENFTIMGMKQNGNKTL